MPNYKFSDFNRTWFITCTTYGQWLPGDERGFVSNKFEGETTERKNNQVGTQYDNGRLELKSAAKKLMLGPQIVLSYPKAVLVRNQFEETARYRSWTIVAGSIMANHFHVLVGVPDDPDPDKILGDLKSYASRKLNAQYGKPQNGTWWTTHGSKRIIDTELSFNRCVSYILSQHAPLLQWINEKPTS